MPRDGFSSDAESVASSLTNAAGIQWHRAGGHALKSTAPTDASRDAFALLQAASGLDRACDVARMRLRELNSLDGAAARKQPVAASSGTARDKYDGDDVSDGSKVQGGLIARNVHSGKQKLRISCRDADVQRAPDGTLRLGGRCRLSRRVRGTHRRWPRNDGWRLHTLRTDDAWVIAGARRPINRSAGDGPIALPRHGARTPPRRRRLRRPLGSLRLSDATLTRLQPVADDDDPALKPEAWSSSGSLDVGLLRKDKFCYWRPHIDQVSVSEYEFSALLYLTRHTEDEAEVEAGQADFSGGELLFHDNDYDRCIRPEPGLLVAFTSGEANLHAVQRVTSGTRFALTMWFTTRPETAHADATHLGLKQWTAALPDHPSPEGSETICVPPPPLDRSAIGREAADNTERASCHGVLSRVPPRRGLVSAALCSLPANDPLGRALLLSKAGQHAEALALGVGLPAEHAYATPPLDGGVSEEVNSMPPPLQPRVAALNALLTTLQRARATKLAVPAKSSEAADPFDVRLMQCQTFWFSCIYIFQMCNLGLEIIVHAPR